MLEFNPARAELPPRDSATLVAVRDAPTGGVEVLCVERRKGGFFGGAIVFPGGQLDPDDSSPAWTGRVTEPRSLDVRARPAAEADPGSGPWAADSTSARGLAIAACREAFEEAAVLPVVGPALTHAELLDWRARAASGTTTLRDLLASAARTLDLASLVPFARWITPAGESRRFDTRFFLFVADDTWTGAHDDRETTASFWAAPGNVLRRFADGELQLAPPTYRALEVLAGASTARDAVLLAETACIEPVCPRIVTLADTLALVLPGDPEHEIRVPRSPGRCRFVLRAGRFLPEDPT